MVPVLDEDEEAAEVEEYLYCGEEAGHPHEGVGEPDGEHDGEPGRALDDHQGHPVVGHQQQGSTVCREGSKIIVKKYKDKTRISCGGLSLKSIILVLLDSRSNS